jgi:hypothetical protein
VPPGLPSFIRLEEPLTEAKMVNLLPSERRDVAYHAPTRIGDVIFNRFD